MVPRIALAQLALVTAGIACSGASGEMIDSSAGAPPPVVAAAPGPLDLAPDGPQIEPAAVPAGPASARPLEQDPVARIIVFAGQPVNAPALRKSTGKLSLSIDPPLPAGLSLDPASGAIRGTASRAAPGAVHLLSGGGRVSPVWVEVLAPASQDSSRFAAPSGSDDNPGTIDRPFRTVAAAAASLRPGMTLYLRQGVYRGSTELKGLRGAKGALIVIRSYPGEHAVLDASEPVFADAPRTAWQKATGPGAHRDEWVSTRAFPTTGKDNSSRGAFLDRVPYTRLLTYSRIEDLRAGNQTFDHIAGDDSRPGPEAINRRKGERDPENTRRPWIYFGPGIHYDRATGRIHIRLSPTQNGIKGIEEYRGARDPRELHLAISARNDHALALLGATHVRVTDLGLHHGGDETVVVHNCSDVQLDHVEIRAATYGLSMSGSSRVRVLHDRIDGGIPPWVFRSDFKAQYQFAEKSGAVATNLLIGKTSRALLYMVRGNSDVEVAYSELENGHDDYLAGLRTDFHHNRIRNVHDEALYFSAAGGDDGIRIHHNVVEKSLSAMSFADKKIGGARRYIYRNVFDLREPTEGFRPDGADRDVWRWGHPFKAAGPIGALFFYQNTVLVARHKKKAAFLHFAALENDGVPRRPRWILNNLLVAIPFGAEFDRALSFMPHPDYLTARDAKGRPLLESDGNLWVRSESSGRPLFRCLSRVRGVRCARKKVVSLADLRGDSEVGGFEAHSREAVDAGFRRLRRLDAASPDDDLRPGPKSPALRAGIALPAELPDPGRPRSGRPDIGAFTADAAPLRVGVDGRHAY